MGTRTFIIVNLLKISSNLRRITYEVVKCQLCSVSQELYKLENNALK